MLSQIGMACTTERFDKVWWFLDASKLPDDRHRCRCARLQLAKLASDREQTVIILNASQLFDNRATIDVRLPPPECLGV
jgi:hypothetical protein